jgi:ABC-type antimicrobial peptide transport system permease subunit
MLVFGSAAAGGLAVAGAITSLLIASRRRVYEMAAIRALGSRARGVLGSLLLELGLITAAAALVGLLAGLVGARAALARLPAFVRASAFPPVLLDLPVLLCVVVLAAVVVAMLGAAAVSGAALVRQASPGRLREAQA